MSSLLKYTGVVLGTLFSFVVHAQDLGIDIYNLNSESNNLQGKLLGEVHVLSSEDNSYFLYPDDWMPGSVSFVNGNVFENMQLRYQAFEDELISYNENGRFLYLVEKELVESFTFEDGNRTRKFIRLTKNNNQQTNMYLEELYKGDISLLVNWYIYEQSVSPFADRNGITRAVDYQLHKDYYLYTEQDGLNKIRLNKRALFSQFPEHKKEIRKLLRQNKLFVNSEASMAKALFLLTENNLAE
ncbi:hypothetical protein [Draconibacterium halophilum]|uniref:Uncharacterized protein n=1 Tax=Draconibacterium halophilum TaxID=2706887 RepID=A0A6C0RJF3_9BACT|nr:hypothetical protein [Draconibacterium halophilum]QIA09301.1 hypothetical protein G0Q07_17005 [Draconibacterium halophilum]